MPWVERWQYQVKAEPLEPIVADFSWFVQASEPVREQPEVVAPTESVLGELPIIPSFDWFVSPPDVIRPRHQVRSGFYVLENVEVLPILWASETTAILGEDQFQYQGKAEPVLVEEPVPDFGWFVPPADVVQPEHQIDEGQFVLGALPIISTFDWFVAPPDVVRPPEKLVPEQFVLGQPPTVPAYDWFLQQADVIRLPEWLVLEAYAFVEFSVPIPLDLDWLVSPPDVIRPPERLIPEQSVLGAEPIIPAFDWFHQQADVVRPPYQVRPGGFALVEFTVPVAINFDWFSQEPDVIRPLHQIRPGLFVLGQPPIIPAFDWFHQQTDVIWPLHQVDEGVFVFLLEIPPPPDFGWFIQQADVIRQPLRPLGLHAKPLLLLAVPPEELVFVIRVCFNLSDLEINRLLPNPSGFMGLLTEPPEPSGYEASEDTTNSLAAMADEDLPSPSGFVGDGE